MNTNTPLLPQLYPRPRINRLHTRRQARARNLCIFAAANEGFHRYIFDLKTTFLECCVPCLIVSNRDQLLNFLIKESLWPALHSKGQPKIGHVRSIFSWSTSYTLFSSTCLCTLSRTIWIDRNSSFSQILTGIKFQTFCSFFKYPFQMSTWSLLSLSWQKWIQILLMTIKKKIKYVIVLF